MPRTKSAQKAQRAGSAKRARNLAQAAKLDRALRTFKRAADHAPEETRLLQKQVDKAAKRGLLHAHRAARLKSRLMGTVSTPSPSAKPVAGKTAKGKKKKTKN